MPHHDLAVLPSVVEEISFLRKLKELNCLQVIQFDGSVHIAGVVGVANRVEGHLGHGTFVHRLELL